MIEVTAAQIYSIKGTEIAYELTYSEGTKVRAVEGNGIIRKECKFPEGWKLVGKPYAIVKNKNRVAERIKLEVVKFIEQGE